MSSDKNIVIVEKLKNGEVVKRYADEINFSKFESVKKKYGSARVWLNSPIVLRKMKSRLLLPDFTDVEIDCGDAPNVLDTGNFVVSSKSVFPTGVNVLKLTGSVFSFSDLLTMNVPRSVSGIEVSSKLLDRVCLENPEEMLFAIKVLQRFPFVCIKASDGIDLTVKMLAYSVLFGKKYDDLIVELEQVLALREEEAEEEVEEEVVVPAKKEKTKPVAAAPVIPDKTAEYLSVNRELVDLFKHRYPEYKNHKKLDRLIRGACSEKSGLAVVKQKMKHGNEIINCVNVADVDVICSYVVAQICAEKQPTVKPVKEEVVNVQADQTDSNKTVEKKPCFSKRGKKEKEVKLTKFDFYITDRVYKKMSSICGKNTGLLLSMMKNAEKINVNPSDAGAVLNIENGNVKEVDGFTFKKEGCLTQSFGSTNEKPRVVWWYSDNVMVACGCFPEHENDPNYIRQIRNVNIDKMLSSKSKNVQVLIDGLTGNIKDSNVQQYQNNRFGEALYELQAMLDCSYLPFKDKQDLIKQIPELGSDEMVLSYIDKLPAKLLDDPLLKSVVDNIKSICR